MSKVADAPLLVDDTFNVTGELAEPFAILLSDEVQEAASQHAEQRRCPTTGLDLERNRLDEPELALAGVTSSSSS